MVSARTELRFPSGGTECAAWHSPGSNGAAVVMAAGTAVTKEPGTGAFGRRFAEAGFTVLAFDFRHLGGSGGQPRQVVRVPEQVADWHAALAATAALPEVDPARIAIWGFSLSGGEVLEVAASSNRVAAAIAQTPLADGRVVTRNGLRHQRPGPTLRLTGRAVRDTVRGVLGRPPLLVPLTGAPGDVAVLTTPDARDGDRALDPDHRYPDWHQEVAARSVLALGSYRPGRRASQVRCPLLVLACDEDRSVLTEPAVQVARQAPAGELVRLPGSHYAPFLDAHEQAVAAELDFLRRHLLAG